MNSPFVSIIFPAFNQWQETKDCLDSITNLNYPKEKIEVIIIDNASTDETRENIALFIKKNLLPRIKLIANSANVGFAKAVNLGIKKSSGEFIFITNNDAVFAKDFLTLLVGYLESHPKVGVVGGKIYYKDRPETVAFSGIQFNLWTGGLSSLGCPDREKESDWIQGCGMLFSKKTVEKVGDFDENYFFNFEDTDFCFRVKRPGLKVVYYPKAVMYHSEGVTINKEGLKRKYLYWYQSKFRFIFKYANILQILSSLIIQFLLVLPYKLLFKHDRNSLMVFPGLARNIKFP